MKITFLLISYNIIHDQVRGFLDIVIRSKVPQWKARVVDANYNGSTDKFQILATYVLTFN